MVIDEGKVFGRRMCIVDLEYIGGRVILNLSEVTIRETVEGTRPNAVAV